MTLPELRLSGGQMTPVVRIGDSVHRAAGPWTPAVHELLRHLERVGFDGAPRVQGIDAKGREVLEFIPGEAGFASATRIEPANLWSEHVLEEAGKLLRRYHDAAACFISDSSVTWQGLYPDVTPHEVICHHDFSPYNCIFQDGHLRAIIDFDSAGPGPRAWDEAYAAYTFVPLIRDEACATLGLATIPDRARRLRRFCDAYGFDARERFVEVIEQRIGAIIAMIEARAVAGDPRFQRKIAEGHLAGYRADRAFIADHRAMFQRALTA
jgi:hypothetical protein